MACLAYGLTTIMTGQRQDCQSTTATEHAACPRYTRQGLKLHRMQAGVKKGMYLASLSFREGIDLHTWRADGYLAL